jgi:hypothetical protein
VKTMQIYNLIVELFMSISLIAGVTMIVFTIGYKHRLRKLEVFGRYILGFLLIYSVTVRFLILLPGKFEYAGQASIGFDLLYLIICLCYNINIFKRRRNGDRKDS